MIVEDKTDKMGWNDFSTYPPQGASVMVHCEASDPPCHHFFSIAQFNAVTVDFTAITAKFKERRKWTFSWLPME